MQQINQYTLQALGRYLHAELADGRFIGAFSQSRDELVLLLKGHQSGAKAWFVRVGCGRLPYVVPIRNFRRAQHNSANLFLTLTDQTIQAIEHLPGERELRIQFAAGGWLELRMHGVHSNVVWRDDSGTVQESFRRKLQVPSPTQYGTIQPMPDNVPEAEWRKHWPWLDAPLIEAIRQAVATSATLQQAADHVARVAVAPPYLVCEAAGVASFHLLPAADAGQCQAYEDLPAALEAWLRLHLGRNAFQVEQAQFAAELAAQLKRWQGRLVSLQRTQEKLATQRSAEELGHLLLANLHLVLPGQAEIAVEDWYHPGTTATIQLDPELNAQQNAEALYRQHRELARKQEIAAKQAAEAEALAQALLAAQDQLQRIGNLHQLRQLVQRTAPLLHQAKQVAPAELPYHVFEHQGWQIWVGRGAERNDRLTFAHAKKDDLWLHARDVPGAHVVVKHKPGQQPPKDVLEHAAGLALHFSRNRTASLAPVSITPRKYVRKHKRLGPGQVVLDRETVLLVPPVKPLGLYDDK